MNLVPIKLPNDAVLRWQNVYSLMMYITAILGVNVSRKITKVVHISMV